MKRCFVLVCTFLLLAAGLRSQDYQSYGGGNFSGVLHVLSNPAYLASSRLKVDVLAAGFDMNFNNSWVGVKRKALSFPDLPGSWKNYTPNLPDNIYKNFVFRQGDKPRSVLLEQRLLLPSVKIKLNAENAFAFTCSLRQMGNLQGINTPLAGLFEKEFDLSVLQNNPVKNTDFSAVRMSWMEYGLSYSAVVIKKGAHQFNAGISPKILQGLESSYFILKDLDFLFSNKDTNSYLKADFEVAHSKTSGSMLNIAENLGERFSNSAPLRLGLDLGISYIWAPALATTKEEVKASAKKTGPVRPIPYRLRAGLSVTDLGRIRFEKEPNYYTMQLSIRQSDIIRYISSENAQMIDSLLRTDFPANTGNTRFTVRMPTSLNAQVDICYNRFFFLNVGAHLTGFYRNTFLKVQNYSAVYFSPRFETYWFEVSVPFTWNALSASSGRQISPGLNLRAGPLSIGSTDLSYIFSNELSSFNFYFLLRVSIPYKSKK